MADDFAMSVGTPDRVLEAQVKHIFADGIMGDLDPQDIGAAPLVHTHVSTDITDSTAPGRALLTASTVQAQRTALDIFVSAANLASFPASGNFQRVYLAQDTGKIYVWNGTGYTEISPNTHTRSGSANVNVGETAMPSVSSGSSNTAVGSNSLNAITTQSNNTAVGTYALFSNTASDNTAIGQNALSANQAGSPNVAVGANALSSNQIGNNQVAVGYNALLASNAYNNTAIGSGAGSALTGGSVNTLIGYNANVDSGGRELCVVIGGGATSPAVSGSLSIGGTGGNTMNGLTTTSAPTGATGTYLRIWLNGTEYRIPIQAAV